MTVAESRPPVSPGEAAPDFMLPTVDGSGTVSLADFREKSAVFLALFIGLWCPFCRRAIAQMSTTEPKLKALGVETLGVVATKPENARLYFKFRPSKLRMAADPDLTTHRAYGLPKPVPTPQLLEALGKTRINPTGELPEPLPVPEAAKILSKLDGYIENETDHADMERQWPMLKGQFLIDREGIVRWSYVECAKEGLAGVGKLPSPDEILAAARSLEGAA
jgi:peroxiredoxin